MARTAGPRRAAGGTGRAQRVARARLTEYDEGWMWWLVAGAAVGLVLVALIARRERKRAGAREARRA